LQTHKHTRTHAHTTHNTHKQLGGGGAPHLTKLVLGVHELNWSVSGLEGIAGQLRELEIHNPFLK
jgi:hypothetical protein